MVSKMKVLMLAIFLMMQQTDAKSCKCEELIGPEKEKNTYFEYAMNATKSAVVCSSIIVGISYVLHAAGFAPSGVTAGSLAAFYQSAIGGAVGTRSLFATLQSVGAGGFSFAAKLGITGTCYSVLKILDSYAPNNAENTFCECNN